jgi:hypothetical protein
MSPFSSIMRILDIRSIVCDIVLCLKELKPAIHSKHRGMQLKSHFAS